MKARDLLILFAALIICACSESRPTQSMAEAYQDVEIRQDWSPEAITTREQRSCHKFGYCLECGFDMQFEYSCGFRASYGCPGKQMIEVVTKSVTIHYESGKRLTEVRKLSERPLDFCR